MDAAEWIKMVRRVNGCDVVGGNHMSRLSITHNTCRHHTGSHGHVCAMIYRVQSN